MECLDSERDWPWVEPIRQTTTNAKNEWWDNKLKTHFDLFTKFIWLIYILVMKYNKLNCFVGEPQGNKFHSKMREEERR